MLPKNRCTTSTKLASKTLPVVQKDTLYQPITPRYLKRHPEFLPTSQNRVLTRLWLPHEKRSVTLSIPRFRNFCRNFLLALPPKRLRHMRMLSLRPLDPHELVYLVPVGKRLHTRAAQQSHLFRMSTPVKTL